MRPNLTLAVVAAQHDEAKREAVVLRAAGEPKPGLVYTATRKDTERYATELSEIGLRAAAYHAGMSARKRASVHEAFLDGALDVVVATTAFGMGIDKQDVRFVLHADVPDSVDSYYQEFGRAGRDGGPATAVLFYRPEDLGLRRFFAAGTPDAATLQRLAALLAYAGAPVTGPDLQAAAALSRTAFARAVNLLTSTGAVVETGGRFRLAADAPEPAQVAARAVELADGRAAVDRSRVEMVRGYAETLGCRWQFLLGYFGEGLRRRCCHCDRCAAGTAEDQPDPQESPYPLGARVEHREWGPGEVLRYEGDRIVVLFDAAGYRTLGLAAVAGGGLLRVADGFPSATVASAGRI